MHNTEVVTSRNNNMANIFFIVSDFKIERIHTDKTLEETKKDLKPLIDRCKNIDVLTPEEFEVFKSVYMNER